MLLLAAGMSAIDPQVYEAAQVDGAARWQQLRIFNEAFTSGNIGRGATVGVALVVVSVAFLTVLALVLGRDGKAR